MTTSLQSEASDLRARRLGGGTNAQVQVQGKESGDVRLNQDRILSGHYDTVRRIQGEGYMRLQKKSAWPGTSHLKRCRCSGLSGLSKEPHSLHVRLPDPQHTQSSGAENSAGASILLIPLSHVPPFSVQVTVTFPRPLLLVSENKEGHVRAE